jgi:sporulation protein YlmC with PRC-barrel domain
MELYSDSRYVNFEVPQFSFHDEYVFEPYVALETEVLVEEQKIPPGELAISRGNEVHASDGRIGTADEFVVDRGTGDITHLVLREGHLWEKRDITIPVSQIRKSGDNEIYLKLSKKEIAKLPSVPVFRIWD